MRTLLTIATLALVPLTLQAQGEGQGYPISPVPFTAVHVTDSFWGQRLRASREVTIPLAFSKCEETGRYTNFERAAQPSESYEVTGYSFDDTDPYKTIEGASYSLQTYPDNRLVHYIDSVLDIIAAAQEPDGYLYTARTQNPQHPHVWAGPERWVWEEDLSHELYNLGHMLESAVAHYQATGSRKFLDIAIRYADCVCRQVGPGEGQACVVPGHQIAEMGLCKLYVLTGERKYLDEAKFLLDYRGRTAVRREYSQSHLPVVDQREAVGHAVRAAYMYAGMADVAALTGDTAYIAAIDSLWDNIVSRKLYLTGGIGATNRGEAFGANYELPNLTAYCETCAAIGNVYVNHRLFLLHGQSKYYDVLERTLYNGLISGVSLDGGGFFYPNPLASEGQHERQPWFGCACCPSNICRFIPSLPGYVYAVRDAQVYVNLFMGNVSTLSVKGRDVELEQTTDYPWSGEVTLQVRKNKAGQWAMKLRIPGWAKGEVVPSDLYTFSDVASDAASPAPPTAYTVTVNGEPAEGSLTADGYFTIERKWKAGDEVRLSLPMQPRTVVAHPAVEADRGRVAICRGPLVYCAEWADNDFDLATAVVPTSPTMQVDDGSIEATAFQTASYPVKVIRMPVQRLQRDDNGLLHVEEARLTLIPYYAWCHRGRGKMRVWLPQDVGALMNNEQ